MAILVVGKVAKAAIEAILATMPKVKPSTTIYRVNLKALEREWFLWLDGGGEDANEIILAKLKQWKCSSADDIKAVIFDELSWNEVAASSTVGWFKTFIPDENRYVAKANGMYEVM